MHSSSPPFVQIQLRTELFIRNSKVQKAVIIQGDVIHVYFGYRILRIQNQLMGTAPVIQEMSGKSKSATDYTRYVIKAILCSRSNDFGHIREEVIKRLDGQILFNWSIWAFF
jgi:hypothetical protein